MAKRLKKVVDSHISALEIKNFKSIKHMKIEPKRINLFIGKPNVGKSNILEAISLLGAGYSQLGKSKYLSDLIRYQEFDELFFERAIENRIEVNSNLGYASIGYHFNINYYDLIIADSPFVMKEMKGIERMSLGDVENAFREYVSSKRYEEWRITPFFAKIIQDGRLQMDGTIPLSSNSPIKKFDFHSQERFDNRFPFYLLPPNGANLYTILQKSKNLRREVADLFKEYKLEFVVKSREPVFEIHKKTQGISTSYPYTSIADTLQRYIFYMIAIHSNKNSTLLFEEPEAHSFPAYIRQTAEMIVDDKQNNQYFITTHSPFILNIILESVKSSELNVYKTYYDKHQTRVELLSDKEISRMLDYGTDIFFNL